MADREKLIEAVEELNYYRNCHYNDSSATVEYKLAQAINDVLPTLSDVIANGVTIQKWIPVSEPPKVHGKYLALTPSKIRRDGYVTWYIRYDPENGWYESDPEWGDIEMDDVAYWMPTPPPPVPPKGE